MKKPGLDVTNVSSYQTSLYCQSFLNILLHISWCSTWHPPTFFCHCSWDFGQVIWLKLQSCECCQTFCRLSTVAIWLLWFFRICQWPLTPLTTQSFFSVCTLSIIWTKNCIMKLSAWDCFNYTAKQKVLESVHNDMTQNTSMATSVLIHTLKYCIN